MNVQALLEQLLKNENLTYQQMYQLMHRIMHGEISSIQLTAFLIALRMKGETIDELTAAATVMRELSTKIPVNRTPLVDIVGTGGDGCNTFNISTTACFVVASTGVAVAKHGNRAVSSQSGSADLLEKAGVNIQLSPKAVAHCVDTIGIGFLFAPNHHQAMKHAVPVRADLGVRTLFNLLGPLTNPANATVQIIGVYDKKWLYPIAEVLNKLGSKNALVVNAKDGLDEISIAAASHIAELNEGKIKQYTLDPKEFGIYHDSLNNIKVNNQNESLHLMKDVLHGKQGAAFDIVVLNAAAALYCAEKATDFNEAITLAKKQITNGEALAKLNALIKLSNELH